MSGLEKLEHRGGLIATAAGGAGQALEGAFSDAGSRGCLTDIAATGAQLGVGTAALDARES
jgi:hypothetical protein